MNHTKLLFVLLGAVFLHFQSFAQVILLQESFETDGEGSRYTSNSFNNVTLSDIWERTNQNPHPDHSTGIASGTEDGTFYWAGEDVQSTLGTAVDAYVELDPLAVFDNIRIRGIACPSLTFGAAATTTCPGTSNGTITIVDPAGGTAPYLYSINSGASYQASATFPNLAAGTYQARIKDANGCESVVVNPTIEARDNIAPTISCPGTQTEFLDASCEVLIPNYTGLATASDNCGALSISQSPPAGTVILGPITVTLSAQDNAGLTTSCTFTVEPKDAISPNVVCPADITVSNDPGLCSAVVDFSPASASDNCDNNLDISYSQDPGTAFDVGTTTVTITVKDDFDNPDDCSFTVTVNDTEDPSITCPADITVNNDPGQCGAVVNYNVTFGDNCPGAALIVNPASGSFFGVGTGSVMASVSDAAGNTAQCNFNVTVKDSEDPIIACPADITVNNIPGQCGANVNYIVNFADNCPGATLIVNPASGSFFGVGSGSVLATVTDAAGNTAQCGFNVTVKDSEDPIIACPADITVNNIPGQCGANVNYIVNFADNCPGATLIVNPASGSFFDVGSGSVLATVTDAAGNTAQCGFKVTVKDNEVPSFSNCPGNISVSNDTGECGADVSWTPPILSDNCPAVSSNSSHNPGEFFPVGSTTVTYTGSDAAGNDASACSFTVTVNDTEVPTFSNCPDPINLFNDEGDCGAVATWTPPVFEDNCPEESFNSTHIPGAFFPVGTTTVTYSGSDKAGNQAIDCSFTVSVTDTEKPKIACPGDISTGTDQGVCGAQVTFTPAIASDNCEVDEVKARYRPVDENGSAIGSWTSRVVDPSGFFPVGRYQVQWRAEDIYGNKESCSHYLEVYDDEDPVAVCKNLTIDFNGQQDISLSVSQVWDEAASSDNCGYVEFVAANLTIGCEELGKTVAIPVTIQDEAGNEDDCTAYVDVIGLPCGWSEGPDDGSLNCDGQTTSDYDVDEESFTLTSDGCWHDCREADKATYVYHPLCGDGTLTAELASINTSGYAGLMARESLDPLARRAGVLKNYSTRRVRREWRSSYGGIVSQSHSNRSRVKWLRIVRKGNEIKSYTSTNGSYWRLLYKTTFSNLEDCIYVGMMAYSLNGSAEVRAVFENVTLSGSGTLAGGIVGDPTSIIPEGLQAWGDVGEVGNGTIEVFPNPAADQAQLVLEDFQDKPAQLVVRDAFGKVVRQIDLDSAMGVVMPLEVHNLAPGVYIISLIQDQQLMGSKRLVVQP